MTLYTYRFSPAIDSDTDKLSSFLKNCSLFAIIFTEQCNKRGHQVPLHYHGLIRTSQFDLKTLRSRVKSLFKTYGINLKGNAMYQLKIAPEDEYQKIMRYFHKGFLHHPLDSINIQFTSNYLRTFIDELEQHRLCKEYWQQFQQLKLHHTTKTDIKTLVQHINDRIQFNTDDTPLEFQMKVADLLYEYSYEHNCIINKYQFTSKVTTICAHIAKIRELTSYKQFLLDDWILPKF